MDRRESRIHNLRSRAVLAHLWAGLIPYHQMSPPCGPKVGLPFVANDPIPDLITVPKDASRNSTPV